MKKLVVFAVLAAIVASCADDNPPQIEKSSELVSPRLLMDVSTESGQMCIRDRVYGSPYTGPAGVEAPKVTLYSPAKGSAKSRVVF